ncbi:PEP-CTERM sorting domain-containing protein [Microcystis aeruginosa CS-555/01A07]|uniref:PEP-CTERM sorting domain-containing protein n=1 Tax=Microcystis aeruginosa TaxID=1126 RepID=UPI00232C00C2|nr:PEP-CTERM sorting domain-containing protein [Microcystis aeruginosa]MDB9427743.1 PEP-CTERM sorting domain-containing protein [Microcystis aeruginosa CS-555/01A07]
MHIDCSCGFKCDAAPPAQTPEPSALVGLGAVVALRAGFKRRPTQADKNSALIEGITTGEPQGSLFLWVIVN